MGAEGSKKAVKVGGLTTGDLVRVDLEVDVFKAMQQGHGGWNGDMAALIGKVGRVHHFTSKKDVVVEYKDSSKVWTIHSGALTKIQPGEGISIGDTVRICANLHEVKSLQVGHGDWVDDMKNFLGKKGTVVKVYADGDLRVTINGSTWTFNRRACTLVAQGSGGEGASTEEEVDPRAALLAALFEQLLEGSVAPTDPDRLVHEAAQGHTDNVRQILTKHPGKVDQMTQGKSALQVACHEGHMAIVQMLLAAGANLGLQDEDGDAALTFSAYGNKPEVMKLLLSKGASINAQNNKGVTALHVAVNKGNMACVQVLLLHKCNINLQDSAGDTALHDAIGNDNKEVVALLLKHPSINFTLKNSRGFNVLQHAAVKGNSFATERIAAQAPHIINSQKDDGFSALHLAAFNQHTGVATVLIKAKAFLDIPNREGLSPLFMAVMTGDMEMVELLLNSGANIHVTDKDGDTCLHFSAIGKRPGAQELLLSTVATVEALKSSGPIGLLGLLASQGGGDGAGKLVQNLAMEAASTDQPEMVRLLLRKGANVNAQNDSGVTTLHMAVNKEKLSCVKILVEQQQCDINLQDKEGDTALHDAILKENAELLDTLLTHKKVDFTLKNKRGFNPLHHAALKGNSHATEKILERAPQMIDLMKEDGFTALHLAALNANHQVASILMTKGRASVNMWNVNHQTPLFLAVSKGDARMVDLLLTKGADPTVVDKEGDTALHDAIAKGSEDVVDRLVQHPAMDFSIANKNGFTVLHHAALRGNNHAVEKILAKAADIVDARKEDGYTALHLASLNGHRDVVFTLLIKGKANVNIYTNDQQTPLHLAVSRDHMRVVDLLVSNGANLNAVDRDGDTCLHLALMRHAALSSPLVQLLSMIQTQLDPDDGMGIACYLCQRGADLHKKNNKGQTPLDLVEDPSLKATLVRYAGASGTQFTPPTRSTPAAASSSGRTPTTSQQASTTKPDRPNSKVEELERMQKRVEDMEETMNCVICRENPRTVAFMCGHTACLPCSHALTQCHMCRKPITKKLNLFN